MWITLRLPLACAALVAGGCCTAEAGPVRINSGMGHAFATSRRGSCAASKAREIAEEACKSRGGTIVFGDQDTAYQGADRNAKAGLDVASILTRRVPGSSVLETDEDYRSTLEFRCQ